MLNLCVDNNYVHTLSDIVLNLCVDNNYVHTLSDILVYQNYG